MQGTQPSAPQPAADTSRNALDFVHRLLGPPTPDTRSLDGLLADLAAAFQASGAGLVPSQGGGPLARHPASSANGAQGRCPWEQDSDFLSRLRQTALPVQGPEGKSFLVAAVSAVGGAGWLLWLEGDSSRTWTEPEAAALVLAGQALTRVLESAEPGTRWAGQLERAARQQRLELAAQVTRRLAHDFGNVLTGILGFSELALTQQVPANTPLHCYLTEVHRGAQNGAHFTHLLRLFSRRQAPPPRSCALAPVLAEEQARLCSGRDSALSLHVRVPPDLPALALDAEHLRQVLGVLLDNARDALVGPGSITVSARVTTLGPADCRDLFGDPQPGPHVEVCIADTGTGLSPEVQRRLFSEPFFSTRPRRRGFGLATAYGILHAHRGGLRLHPGAERGVVARFVVPVAATPAPLPTQPSAVQPARGERVLVVDDDPKVLQFVSATLERAGYRVEAVSNAEDALACYAAAPPDPFRLVLSDVIMPHTGGVDLARRLLSRDANVRVLFMSGQVSPDFTQPDIARCQFDLLTKPFRPDGLLRAVRAALARATPESRAPAARPGDEPVLSSAL